MERSNSKVEEYGALWLAGQIDRDMDLVRIVDEVVPEVIVRKGRPWGIVFLYCIWNRMCESTAITGSLNGMNGLRCSKIRPVDIGETQQARGIGRSGQGN